MTRQSRFSEASYYGQQRSKIIIIIIIAAISSHLSLKLLHSQHAYARGHVVPNSVHLSSVTLQLIRVISTQSAFNCNSLSPTVQYK